MKYKNQFLVCQAVKWSQNWDHMLRSSWILLEEWMTLYDSSHLAKPQFQISFCPLPEDWCTPAAPTCCFSLQLHGPLFFFFFKPFSYNCNCLSGAPLVTSSSGAMHLNRIIFRFFMRRDALGWAPQVLLLTERARHLLPLFFFFWHHGECFGSGRIWQALVCNLGRASAPLRQHMPDTYTCYTGA